MYQLTLTELLSVVKTNLESQIYTQGQFNNLNEVIYLRRKIPNTFPFLLTCRNGLVSCISFDGFEYNVPKNVRNALLNNFSNHETFMQEFAFEMLVGPVNTFFLNDIFLDKKESQELEYSMQSSRQRFTLMLKLFRETLRSESYSFNLPKIDSSINYVNNTYMKLQEYDTFHFMLPSNKIEVEYI